MPRPHSPPPAPPSFAPSPSPTTTERSRRHGLKKTWPPTSPSSATVSRRTAAGVSTVSPSQSSPSTSAADASFVFKLRPPRRPTPNTPPSRRHRPRRHFHRTQGELTPRLHPLPPPCSPSAPIRHESPSSSPPRTTPPSFRASQRGLERAFDSPLHKERNAPLLAQIRAHLPPLR